MSLRARPAWVSISPLKAFLYLLLLTAILAIPIYILSSARRAQFNVLYMLIPSVVPFGLFALDRLQTATSKSPIRSILDIIVLVFAITRIFSSWPYMSGHSLFFSYATFTTNRVLTRLVSVSALIYTGFWKITHSDNLPELWTGVLYGLGFACLFRLLTVKSAQQDAAANP